MSTTQLSVRWTGEELNYIGTDSKGNQLQIGGQSLSPGQMVLLGLASCMGMDVVSILKKKQQQISDVEVEIIAHQPDKHPRLYETVEVHFTVKGENVESKAVARSIELSRDRYSIVGHTFQRAVDLKTSFAVKKDYIPEHSEPFFPPTGYAALDEWWGA